MDEHRKVYYLEDYKKLYFSLFNDITDIIQSPDLSSEQIIRRLKQIQCEAEQRFITWGEQTQSGHEE